MSKQRFVLLLILIGALSRLIPHPANFTALGAIALFAGAKIGKQYLDFLIPVAALWLSDLLVNNILYAAYYDSFIFFTEGFMYMAISMVLSVMVGRLVLSKMTTCRLLSGTLISSVLFFVITNFGVWMATTPGYPQSFQGLMLCYEAAIPFFRNEFLGTLVYSGVFFGLYEWVFRSSLLPAKSR
ncbi:MAG: hypothetical protein J4F31_00550 [Flavobacteriales bacterium]|nr:hypothetical protein [Flavobacteriales bacterium]